MRSYYQRPENALKRADELIAVGQQNAALEVLYEVITSKRSRNASINVLEPVMHKFVELCVDQRKGKLIKDGLYQFKNFAQGTSITAIETVVKRFLSLSEEKLHSAQEKAEQINLNAVEDLEESETPESLLLGTVSGEQSKDRTDRAVVTPWLRFLWEGYRTVLDTLRNNARLELLYQQVAHQTIQFCLQYMRKTELRRLADLMRHHLSNVSKYQNQPHSIDLADPDTLQRHLDARVEQLNAAVKLELWQEAFRSVEDIYNLLAMSKKAPKPHMMANYYENLAKIFLVGENYLFHAAAQQRSYFLWRVINKDATPEEHVKAATGIFTDVDESKSKLHRLTNLLGLTKAPTRSGLLKDLIARGVLQRVPAELRQLYEILEVTFHPLSICKKIEPLLARLAEDDEMKRYIEPLHQVVLTRLLQQLSQVYTTVKMDTVVKLASFPPPFDYDRTYIEKFIMNGCRRGDLMIRVDHHNGVLTFETSELFAAPAIAAVDGVRLQMAPPEAMRQHLASLGKGLQSAINTFDPSVEEERKLAKSQSIARALFEMVDEHKRNAARKAVIERKKEIAENLQMQKEKEQAMQRIIRMQQEKAAEKARQEQEARKRQIEQQEREREAIEREEARKLAESLTEKAGIKVDAKTLETLDTDKLVELQVKQIEDEKAEIQARLKGVSKRLDHTERAFRKEEIPLLERDYVRQRKADRHYYEAARTARIQAAREKHARDLKLKQKMTAIMPDYREFRGKLEGGVREDYDRHCQEVAKQLEKAKKQRIQEYRELKYEVEQRRKAEAAERAQREEEERRQREQREREEREQREREEKERREREEREAKERAEREERERKLAEQMEKQRERERLAEEKLAAQRRGLSVNPPAASPSARTEERPWRRAESTTVAAATAATPTTTPPPSSPSVGSWRRSESIRRQESTRTELPPLESSWRRSDSNPTSAPLEPSNSWRSRAPPGVRASQSPRSTDMSRNASTSSTGGAERSPGFMSPRGGLPAEGGWRTRDSPKDTPRPLRTSQSANTSGNATPTESRPTTSDVDADGFTLVTKGRGQRR
ncbi:hypothetical protein BDF22DRAFT_682249 [Syncephalis plumigaleata]|nr:hypothetical protein BDF22DRAFT_682249 [Syncephalis plumigaleata]